MFCAATITAVPAVRSTTVLSAVNGGQITTPTSGRPPASGRNASMNAFASRLVLFIFQFAAIRGCLSPVIQCLQSRELLALQQLERRSAAGRYVRDLVREPELRDRRGRVAAAHHGRAAIVRQRARDRARARGERLQLECS